MGCDMWISKLPRKQQYARGFKPSVNLGYWRDSYNKSNLLWQFGMSYWADINNVYCSRSGRLSLKRTQHLLDELEMRRKPIFEKNLQALLDHKNRVWDDKDAREILSDEDRVKWVARYRSDYREFRRFLKRALALKSSIICSL